METKEKIVNSLLNLMQKYTYKDIGVKMICGDADLSRQTFYNCFKEKDEVLKLYLNTHFTNWKKTSFKINTLRDIVHYFIEGILTMKEILKIMIDNNLGSFLNDEFSYSINNLSYNFGLNNDLNASYRNEFISGAISRTIIYWFKDSNPIPINELENIIVYLIEGLR